MIKSMRTYIPSCFKRIYRRTEERLNYYIAEISQPRETYIVSFPKTGRTWLRLLIGKYICDKYNYPDKYAIFVHPLTIHSGLSPTLFGHDRSDQPHLKYNKLTKNKRRYTKNKVIFLARNIKDTLVSYYFQVNKRDKLFKGSISKFIHSEYFGVKKIVNFYNIWYINRTIPKEFIFVRYENLHDDPYNSLTQILRFISIKNIEESLIKKAVEFSRFENMRKMERNNRFKTSILSAKDKNDINTFKVRKGVVGGYRDFLNESDINYIDQIIKEMGCPFETHPYYKHVRLFKNH